MTTQHIELIVNVNVIYLYVNQVIKILVIVNYV